jgi:hypothetical protein
MSCLLITLVLFVLLLPQVAVSSPGLPTAVASTTTLDALMKSQSVTRWGWAPSPCAKEPPNFSKKPQLTRGAPALAAAVREASGQLRAELRGDPLTPGPGVLPAPAHQRHDVHHRPPSIGVQSPGIGLLQPPFRRGVGHYS